MLRADTGVSDDEVIEAPTMDRRWQLVLDCLDAAHAPFSKGTLVAFRQRLIAAGLDRRLIERTLVRDRHAELVIYGKAWPVYNPARSPDGQRGAIVDVEAGDVLGQIPRADSAWECRLG